MKTNWQTKKLGEVLKLQNGFAFDSKKFSTKKGIPLIRIRDLKNGINTETKYNGDYKDLYIVKSGDFLIGMDGEFCCYEWRGSIALLNQRVCRLKDFKGLDSRFIYYGINKYLKDIELHTGFTTVKHISSKQIENILFSFPESKSEQQRIVKLLDSVFEKIDKAKENVEKNLQNIKELFNSILNDNNSPKVPLGRLVHITTGKLNSNAAVIDGKYPFFTCSRDTFLINKFSFNCEAILLAGNNAVGNFNVKHYKGKFDAYQRTYVITIVNEEKILYRFLYFEIMKSLKELKKKSVGTGTKFLKLPMIKEFEISLPTLEDQRNIVDKLNAISELTGRFELSCKQKLSYLEELKKSILKRAFNGEL